MHVSTPKRKAMKIQHFNSVTPGRSASLASVGLSHSKTKGQKKPSLCFSLRKKHTCWQPQGKSMPFFLREDVEQMSWEPCPFTPPLPAASRSWINTQSHSSGAGRAAQCNTARPWSTPSRSKIGEAAHVINLGQGHGGETLQESLCGCPSNEGCPQSLGFSQSPQFLSPFRMLPSKRSAGLGAGECVIVLLPLELNISTGRRGKKADEYCMIRGRERDGAVAALLTAERQKHTRAPRRCSQHQQTSLRPLFPSPYPASQQHVPTLCAADRGSPDTEALGFFFWGVRKCFLLFPTPSPRLGSLPGEVRYVSSSAPLPWRCPIPMQSSYHTDTLSNEPRRRGLARSLQLRAHGHC